MKLWFFCAGVIRALRKDDYITSTYRDHVHALSKGVPAKNIMAELFGKKTGICRGQGGSMHMFSREHNLVGGAAVAVCSSLLLGPLCRLCTLVQLLCQTMCRPIHSASQLVPGTLQFQQAWVCRTASAMYFPLPAARRLCLHWRGYPCGTGCSLQDQVHESEPAFMSSNPHGCWCQQQLCRASLLSAAKLSSACQGTCKNSPALTCRAAVLPRRVVKTFPPWRCRMQWATRPLTRSPSTSLAMAPATWVRPVSAHA